MKVIYLTLFLWIAITANAQDYNGQWRGSFTEASYSFAGFGNNKIDYVLELQTSGSSVTGYSYTYFYEGSRKYYTICTLKGTLNRQTKEIVVTETNRVKYNTPPGFQNCFQTHRLQYYKDSGDIEVLKGTWIPAPNQSGDCGYGTTFLSRKIVKNLVLHPPVKKKEEKRTPRPVHAAPKPKTGTAFRKPVHEERTPLKMKTTPSPVPKPPVVMKEPKVELSVQNPPMTITAPKPDKQATVPPGFEVRRKDILKTIAVTQPTFRVDFYDNGEIDGDSITVFYNGKIILLHKMLSDKAITLHLTLDKDLKQNVLTMYADNLGSIPPNTALMIVTDGTKRYEVRIDSDTEKSGSVIFESASPSGETPPKN